MDNFTYASAINYYGHLPREWTPANNGWPIFLSFWFSIINLENTQQYMDLQRMISIVLSGLIVIPVYFLCKKFFDEKLALVGSALFVFDPRIILNSLLGITEPLFILLAISSLVIFLRHSRSSITTSFVLASLATIVRSEGLFLFATLTILFFVKYKLSREIVKTYLPCVVIFLLILSPIMIYKIEVTGYDGIFQRAAYGTGQILTYSGQDKASEFASGLELFAKYLGWIMIPIFIVFVPFGFVQFLRERTKETNFILVYLIVSSLPILYAYLMQAQDTRYLYVLYPIFCLISLFSIKKYISRFTRQNIMLFLIVAGIFVASIGFYEYKKIDYTKERELNEIAKTVAHITSGVNFHPSETRYIRAAELPEKWPFVLFTSGAHKIKSIPTTNYQNLDSFISDSRGSLTHILVDDDPRLPEFLQRVYNNEQDYEFLIKIFDSQDIGFKHHVKLFEIDFDRFDSDD